MGRFHILHAQAHAGQLGGGPQGRAGGDSHQDALGADQLPSGGKCVLVPDPDDLVVDAPVQGVRDEVGADPLDLVGAGLAAGEQGGGVRLHRRHMDGGVLLLQIAGGSGEGTAGAHTGHQHIDLALGVRPDLRAGGAVVGVRVGGVVELPGDKAAGDGAGKLLRLLHRALHPQRAGGEDQLRPIGGQHGPALRAHGIRHGEDQAVAPDGGHTGQADAGVPGGGLNDHSAGLQQPPGLRVLDHGQTHTVLGGAGGIQVFQLGQHLGGEAVSGPIPLQSQQGGVSNQIFHAVCDF